MSDEISMGGQPLGPQAEGTPAAAITAEQQSHSGTPTSGDPAAAQRARWARIPREFTERSQWVLAGTSKQPLTTSGRPAKSTDPSTWTDFDTASDAAIERGLQIGYVISENDPFTCIDLDWVDASTQTAKGKPIDPSKWTTPAQWDRFLEIAEAFDSYTEWSLSGRGMHIWAEGKIGRGRRRDNVEMYSQERLIIFTGNVINNKPVQPRYALLNILVAELSRGSQLEVELEEIDDVDDWYIARTAHEDEGEMGRLFRTGEWSGKYQSASEADQSLVTMLCRLSESNKAVWSAFQMSPLGKRLKDGKVKSQRKSYQRSTLIKARTYLANDALHIARGKEISDALFWKVCAAPIPVDPSRLKLLFDNDLERLPPQGWLVKGIIPESGIGAIYGPSGSFKSFIALDLLAHISNGRSWFGNRVKAVPAVYVPFEGKGGIPKRVAAWRLAQSQLEQPGALCILAPAAHVKTNIAFITDSINLRIQTDRDKLVATLVEQGWSGGVLCIDTLAQAGAGIEENSSEGMGEMIAVFQELQHRLGGVVTVIHHNGKDATKGLR
jgi:hypothetical protein